MRPRLAPVMVGFVGTQSLSPRLQGLVRLLGWWLIVGLHLSCSQSDSARFEPCYAVSAIQVAKTQGWGEACDKDFKLLGAKAKGCREQTV